MQFRSQTQNHPRLFIKFINFLKSLKKIFTFFFFVPSIENTNSKRSRPHSSKSVNNFASYKRKTKESKRADFHVSNFHYMLTVAGGGPKQAKGRFAPIGVKSKDFLWSGGPVLLELLIHY